MNQTEFIYPTNDYVPPEEPKNYKILFLIFLGQTAMSIAFNWVRKVMYLIRTDIKKLFMIIFCVSLQYFYYCSVVLEMTTENIIDKSLFWITSITLLLIDLCVHPE